MRMLSFLARFVKVITFTNVSLLIGNLLFHSISECSLFLPQKFFFISVSLCVKGMLMFTVYSHITITFHEMQRKITSRLLESYCEAQNKIIMYS